jgi:hypothetical protein
MKLLFLIISMLLVTAVCAQNTAKDDILANYKLSGSNICTYIEPTNVTYTNAPKGYKPIYLSMYARHGSRHLSVQRDYDEPLALLRNAYSKACISTLGKRTMSVIDSLERMAHGRVGELTVVGAQQHQGIAKRIYEHFPELFTNNVHLEARSTPLQRTMMSMINQCVALKGCYPQLTVNSDASQHDVWYMDTQDAIAYKYRKTPEAVNALKKYSKKMINPHRFVNAIFTDQKFIDENVKPTEFMHQMFTLANMAQNEGLNIDIYDIFKPDEIFNMWKRDNFKWYIEYTFNPLTQYKVPYTQIHLLRNIITVADTCLMSKNNNLTLRFGHEVDLLPLACLMKLHETVYEGTDGDEVAEHWRNYNIYPMAGNIQLVFYRKAGSPDIVKIMLNEREQTIPLKSDIAPYYKWDDVKKYFCDIIAKAPKE